MRRLFPPALLSGGGLARLLAVADRLPLCVIDRRLGFEFPLLNEAATADLCVVVEPGSSLAAHYVRLGVCAAPDSEAAALGACLDWTASDPASFLARGAGIIILEYDVPARRRGEPPPPGIFFVPRDDSISAARKLLDDPADAIERLTNRRWCLPAKADGLRAWPGARGVLGPHGVLRVYQYLNHIKVVVDRGDIAAKAYAGMVVRRFDK